MWTELGYLWTNYRSALHVKRQLTAMGIKAKVGRVTDEQAWYVENETGEMLDISVLTAEQLDPVKVQYCYDPNTPKIPIFTPRAWREAKQAMSHRKEKSADVLDWEAANSVVLPDWSDLFRDKV